MTTAIDDVLALYEFNFSKAYIEKEIHSMLRLSYDRYNTVENLKKIFSCIDLTSLNTSDNILYIKEIARKVNGFKKKFPHYNNIAAVCVYPSLLENLKNSLVDPDVKIASVAGCFPSSQSYIEVKKLECEMAKRKGAHELDVVIPVGALLEGKYQQVYDEIVLMKKVCGNDHLKVILETGELKTSKNIYIASIIAMKAGADFIKTSTGKVTVNATHEAAYVMCHAIKHFHLKMRKKIGVKIAGGISSAKSALEYFILAGHILGKEWLHKDLFRIGASKLCNDLLTQIFRHKNEKSHKIKYF